MVLLQQQLYVSLPQCYNHKLSEYEGDFGILPPYSVCSSFPQCLPSLPSVPALLPNPSQAQEAISKGVAPQQPEASQPSCPSPKPQSPPLQAPASPNNVPPVVLGPKPNPLVPRPMPIPSQL